MVLSLGSPICSSQTRVLASPWSFYSERGPATNKIHLSNPPAAFLSKRNRSPINLKMETSSLQEKGKALHAFASQAKEGESSDFDVEKFEKDFEERFRLPHLTDIFDIKPIRTTFCINNRRPMPHRLALHEMKKKRSFYLIKTAGMCKPTVEARTFYKNHALTRKDTAVCHMGKSFEKQLHGCPLPEKFSDDPTEDLRKMFVHNDDRVLLKVIKFANPTSAGAECVEPNCNFVHQWVHRAGPRPEIYFEPSQVKAAIVTCGGLCPGLNDVIRQIVTTLETYGVKDITGIMYGYRGLTDASLASMPLSRKVVQNIHLSGGSILGVSRGGGNVTEIVDSIQEKGYNMLFVLGGNGTHAGANAIHDECRKRRMKVVVVGVPKTIDNDILLMDKTFGFDTAVEEAQRAINAAYIEAHSAYNGIGIVKLMGRSSGFIAMHASLASGQIDVCLIPEVSFKIDGPGGLLQHLQDILQQKGSAVICVAEGAGQDLFEKNGATDASGNPVLGDIGVYLQQQVKNHFKKIGMPADVKYIDPTYMIRAIRANASDGILCTVLGQNAVHGAFAGFSGITVGICSTHYVYLPIPEVITYPRQVDPNSRMWHRCLTSTGQPDFH